MLYDLHNVYLSFYYMYNVKLDVLNQYVKG